RQDVAQVVEAPGLHRRMGHRLADVQRRFEPLPGSGQVALGAKHLPKMIQDLRLHQPVADLDGPGVCLLEEPPSLAELAPLPAQLGEVEELGCDADAATESLGNDQGLLVGLLRAVEVAQTLESGSE